MAKNSKTPIMVLQELAQKLYWAPPVYSITLAIDWTHNNYFEFKVIVGDTCCVGEGPSKQIAKQTAALRCLKELERLKVYNPQDNPVQNLSSCDEDVTYMNYMKLLKDLCYKYNLKEPIFSEVLDSMTVHCKEFTYECRVANLKTHATAGSKNQAKQEAAEQMLDKVKMLLPELEKGDFKDNVSKHDVKLSIVDIINRYQILNNIVLNNFVPEVKIFKNVVEWARSLEYSYTDFEEDLTQKTIESLMLLLKKLKLSLNLVTIQEEPPVVLSNVNTNTPLSATGFGENFTKAV